MTMFSSPAPTGSQLDCKDVLGHLLLIKPTSVELQVKTVNGISDAVRADIADLSTGQLHESVMWFPKLLVSSLRNSIGQMVLGVMTQGQPKPGQSPPWILQDAANDPNAVQMAQGWLAQNPTFDPSRPNVTAPALAYQAAPQQPAPPAYQQPVAPVGAPAYQMPGGVNAADV